MALSRTIFTSTGLLASLYALAVAGGAPLLASLLRETPLAALTAPSSGLYRRDPLTSQSQFPLGTAKPGGL
ncbi:hypothetical protein LJR029_001316 [Caballeronia sp. LjRoot29]|uniref:hypothetical protein n=1 Tax=Caballeronia sp. LjRoot29 TaxID=3342315 RepID=UPI003ECC524A